MRLFHSFSPSLSHPTQLLFQDVLLAMKSLGFNPAEQETIDMTNEVGNNGLVYFPDFCKIVLRKYREDDKELLNQALFKVKLVFGLWMMNKSILLIIIHWFYSQ